MICILLLDGWLRHPFEGVSIHDLTIFKPGMDFPAAFSIEGNCLLNNLKRGTKFAHAENSLAGVQSVVDEIDSPRDRIEISRM